MLLNLLEDHPFFRVKTLVGVLRFAPFFPLAVVAFKHADLKVVLICPMKWRDRDAGWLVTGPTVQLV